MRRVPRSSIGGCPTRGLISWVLYRCNNKTIRWLLPAPAPAGPGHRPLARSPGLAEPDPGSRRRPPIGRARRCRRAPAPAPRAPARGGARRPELLLGGQRRVRRHVRHDGWQHEIPAGLPPAGTSPATSTQRPAPVTGCQCGNIREIQRAAQRFHSKAELMPVLNQLVDHGRLITLDEAMPDDDAPTAGRPQTPRYMILRDRTSPEEHSGRG
jgi:hypothetical protein